VRVWQHCWLCNITSKYHSQWTPHNEHR
jgi:hypothetical protein